MYNAINEVLPFPTAQAYTSGNHHFLGPRRTVLVGQTVCDLEQPQLISLFWFCTVSILTLKLLGWFLETMMIICIVLLTVQNIVTHTASLPPLTIQRDNYLNFTSLLPRPTPPSHVSCLQDASSTHPIGQGTNPEVFLASSFSFITIQPPNEVGFTSKLLLSSSSIS